jgi:hypothetical protein
VADDVAREVVEDDEHVKALVADTHFGEVELPEGISAWGLEAKRLWPFRPGATMHGLIAVTTQHAGDGLERDTPALETLELGAELGRSHGWVLALELKDGRDLMLAQPLSWIRRRVR